MLRIVLEIPNTICDYPRKMNPKTVVRRVENQPNIYFRIFKRYRNPENKIPQKLRHVVAKTGREELFNGS